MDGKLRVAIIGAYPLSPDKVQGGVRSVTQNLVHGLNEYDDLDIHVVHCHSDVPTDRTLLDGRATIHFMALPKRRIVPNMITGIGRICDLLEELKPQVVNAHTGSYAVAGLRSGYPTAYTIHCVTRRYMWAVGGWFDHARLFLDAIFDNYAASRVKDIVAISPYVVNSYRWASQARFHRVDNPVSDVFLSAGDRAARGRILFAGSITEVKNVLMLMRALRRIRSSFPEAHLHVAGWVTSARYRRAIDGFLAENEMHKQVRMLGLLDTGSLIAQYEEASVLVLPSKEETQPIVILEAMAAGKPVVATNVGGVADLIDDGLTGYVVPSGDEVALADRVGRILANPELGRQMGEKGREKVLDRFDARRAARLYREVYHRVAGPGKW